MQVNFHGSPCIPGVFLYCFGYRTKTKFSPKSARKYAIFDPKIHEKFSGATALSPDTLWGEGHLLALLAPRLGSPWLGSPRLGSSLRHSTLLPNFTSWIDLWPSSNFVNNTQNPYTHALRGWPFCLLKKLFFLFSFFFFSGSLVVFIPSFPIFTISQAQLGVWKLQPTFDTYTAFKMHLVATLSSEQ